ncbi:MAG: sigma-54-dependent Fis family transcriptional regulator [Deltaproteobacteria bacterium]|nr:sigma-54-dependent Fis family transcriptional regulator [Deltaproteobacteria bacterium]
MSEIKAKILVVDDELSMRELLEIMLTAEGYEVLTAENGKKAVSMIGKTSFNLILCDIRLGDMTGIDVLKSAKTRRPETVFIMISAYASAENAVEAMNCGAYDYLPKPFDNEELKQTIAKALEISSDGDVKKRINDEIKQHIHYGILVGNSLGMQKIYKLIDQIAPTNTNVLVTGESGTGKELIAKAIHNKSPRNERPFVVVNCGSIPESLVESEFFGYKKGAFTGASHDKKGLFEAAHTGTIFLDEIGELDLQMQVKLLRVVQERSFKPVGDNIEKQVDIRIISATNKTLVDEVIEGRFREDLYYRLNVVEIRVPPLRERKTDIRLLAQHFLEKHSRITGREISKISSYAVDLLQRYDFPGNIRELENLIERSVALSTTNIILPESLSLSIHKRRWIEGMKNDRYDLEDVSGGVMLDDIMDEIERAYIEKALASAGGSKTHAAELLGINLRSIRYRCSKLGIDQSGDK